MDARQDLGEVAIALIGDDDRGAGLGDEEIGAGDADIGGEEPLAQHAARLAEQRCRLAQVTVRRQVGMGMTEVGLDLLLSDMHGRRDDVARRLMTELDDVFAEIGLDRRDVVFLEILVEADLLGHHRLALGHRPGVDRAADVEDLGTGVLGRLGIVDVTTGGPHLLLIGLEIEVEMSECVVLDVSRIVAQGLELGQFGGRLEALVDKAGTDMAQRLLQLLVVQGAARVFLEGWRSDIHDASPGLANRRRFGHIGQHLGDVAHGYLYALALQLAGHVH